MKTFSKYIAIIFVCTLAGIPMAVFVTWGHLFPTSEPPSKLPSPPVLAEAVVGISSIGFFDFTPMIRAVDEKIYIYTRDEDTRSEEWQSDIQLPNSLASDPELCESDTLELITGLAGEVKECVAIVPMGEWCSAPLTSIAVTENGEVWQYEKELPCTHFFILMFPIFMVFGFVVGIMIVLYMVFRAFIRRFRVMK